MKSCENCPQLFRFYMLFGNIHHHHLHLFARNVVKTFVARRQMALVRGETNVIKVWESCHFPQKERRSSNPQFWCFRSLCLDGSSDANYLESSGPFRLESLGKPWQVVAGRNARIPGKLQALNLGLHSEPAKQSLAFQKR